MLQPFFKLNKFNNLKYTIERDLYITDTNTRSSEDEAYNDYLYFVLCAKAMTRSKTARFQKKNQFESILSHKY